MLRNNTLLQRSISVSASQVKRQRHGRSWIRNPKDNNQDPDSDGEVPPEMLSVDTPVDIPGRNGGRDGGGRDGPDGWDGPDTPLATAAAEHSLVQSGGDFSPVAIERGRINKVRELWVLKHHHHRSLTRNFTPRDSLSEEPEDMTEIIAGESSEDKAQAKKKEMEEELSRLRKMQEDIEVQHLDYRRRLEKKIIEEQQKKEEVEAELTRTRERLLVELDNVEQTKALLTAEINSLKAETEKKKDLEAELERVKLTKEKMDAEVESLKKEAERRKLIELELEDMTRIKDSLTNEIESLKAETTKKKDLELELARVHEMREKLNAENEHLKAEAERRKQIENELEQIQLAKSTLLKEMASKEESEKKQLEKELEVLKNRDGNLMSEIDHLKAETERRKKIEQDLSQLLLNKEKLSSEIEALKEDADKKKHLEIELERVKHHREKLTSEIDKLKAEQEKRLALELELEQIKTIKQNLTDEIESLKLESARHVKLSEELSEVKDIKERLATEIQILKKKLEEKISAQTNESVASKKDDEEKAKLAATVAKQQKEIAKLKESLKTPSSHTKRVRKTAGLGLSLKLKLPPPQEGRLGTLSFKKAFVTGGSGFIGQALILALVEHKVEVVALCREEACALLVKKLGAIPVLGDIRKREEMTDAMQGCDVVYHLAAKTGYAGEWSDFEKINIHGSEYVCVAAKMAGVKRLVYCSDAVVIREDSPKNCAADETIPIKPEKIGTSYPRSKAIAEKVVLRHGQQGLEVVVVRLPWVWGQGDSKLKIIAETIKDNSFSWVNGGSYLYSACHITNAIEGLLLAGKNGPPGETYFIADDGYPMQFRDFLTRMLATQNIDCSDVMSMPSWLGSAVSWFQKMIPGESPVMADLSRPLIVSDKKARQLLGYKGLTTFEKGLDMLREEFIYKLTTPRYQSDEK